MLTVVTGALLAQITSVQLAPISVHVDSPLLRFDGVPCGVVSRRHTLVTNAGKDALRIRHGLVYAPHFNGGLTTGATLRTLSGESQDMEFVYAPGQPEEHRGHVDVLAEYDDEVIEAERARIEALAKKELADVAEELSLLLEEEEDDRAIFDAMDAKARADNRKEHADVDYLLDGSIRKLMNLHDEHHALKEEMMRGEFCTGCDLTRSQILAKGDQFPHPGKQIRSATPADLEKLKKKYDALLDKERKEASELRGLHASADVTMRQRLEEIARKREAAKALREKQTAALRAEELELEARRKALQAQLTELDGKQTVTRITLVGRCSRKP